MPRTSFLAKLDEGHGDMLGRHRVKIKHECSRMASVDGNGREWTPPHHNLDGRRGQSSLSAAPLLAINLFLPDCLVWMPHVPLRGLGDWRSIGGPHKHTLICKRLHGHTPRQRPQTADAGKFHSSIFSKRRQHYPDY